MPADPRVSLTFGLTAPLRLTTSTGDPHTVSSLTGDPARGHARLTRGNANPQLSTLLTNRHQFSSLCGPPAAPPATAVGRFSLVNPRTSGVLRPLRIRSHDKRLTSTRTRVMRSKRHRRPAGSAGRYARRRASSMGGRKLKFVWRRPRRVAPLLAPTRGLEPSRLRAPPRQRFGRPVRRHVSVRPSVRRSRGPRNNKRVFFATATTGRPR